MSYVNEDICDRKVRQLFLCRCGAAALCNFRIPHDKNTLNQSLAKYFFFKYFILLLKKYFTGIKNTLKSISNTQDSSKEIKIMKKPFFKKNISNTYLLKKKVVQKVFEINSRSLHT